MRLDALTLELLRNYLHGAVEDMAYAVERTAHTTFVKETADFTCGLITPAGDFFAYPVELGVASMAGINYARTLEAVGLSNRADHQPSQLSGGQQQRVAIARALVNSPALILADEPTGNLDTRTSVEIMALMQTLNRQGITVVLITHEHDISEYAGRVIHFRDGRLQSDERNARPRDAQSELRDLPPDEDEATPTASVTAA